MRKIWLGILSAVALIIAVPGLAIAGGTHSAAGHNYVSPSAVSSHHALAVAHPVHPFHTHPFQAHPQRSATRFSTVNSNNWSGFATYGDHFRFVSATYSIPSVNCAVSPGGSFDTQWVGLDGYTTRTVEQIGTYAQCSGGAPSYFAFYEMYPDAAVQMVAVHPGDSITASVYYSGSSKTWNLTLRDNTEPQLSVSQSQSCPSGSICSNANAEVISEVPNGGPPTASLADYGIVGFTQIGITDYSAHHYNLFSPYWKNDKIFEVNSANNHLMQSPSKLEGGASGSGGGYGNQAFTDTAFAAN
jgi:hypothetical protein